MALQVSGCHSGSNSGETAGLWLQLLPFGPLSPLPCVSRCALPQTDALAVVWARSHQNDSKLAQNTCATIRMVLELLQANHVAGAMTIPLSHCCFGFCCSFASGEMLALAAVLTAALNHSQSCSNRPQLHTRPQPLPDSSLEAQPEPLQTLRGDSKQPKLEPKYLQVSPMM